MNRLIFAAAFMLLVSVSWGQEYRTGKLTWRSVYDLDFDNAVGMGPFHWGYFPEGSNKVEKSVTEDGRDAIVIQPHCTLSGPRKFVVSGEKTILLPPYSGNGYRVSLSGMGKNLSSRMKFTVTGLDMNERECFVCDTLIPYPDLSWQETVLAVNGSESLKALRVRFEYIGDRNAEQRLWLDRLCIMAGNDDIASWCMADRMTAETPIIKKRIVTDADDVFAPGNKVALSAKIIGLGNSGGMSSDVCKDMYEMSRRLVENRNCRFILFNDVESSECAVWNDYIRGVSDIKGKEPDEMQPGFLDFMGWLRVYNSGKTDKVEIVGSLGAMRHESSEWRPDYSFEDWICRIREEQFALVRLCEHKLAEGQVMVILDRGADLAYVAHEKAVGLGRVLKETYKDRYFSISFHSGDGIYKKYVAEPEWHIESVERTPAPNGSIEKAFMNTGMDSFYCAAEDLPDGIFLAFSPMNSFQFELFSPSIRHGGYFYRE